MAGESIRAAISSRAKLPCAFTFRASELLAPNAKPGSFFREDVRPFSTGPTSSTT